MSDSPKDPVSTSGASVPGNPTFQPSPAVTVEEGGNNAGPASLPGGHALKPTSAAALDADVAEEMDMFDIELQRECQHRPLAYLPPGAGNKSSPAALARSPPSFGAEAVFGHGVKRLPSVAEACQLTRLVQDKEGSKRLLHALAEEIRREMSFNSSAAAEAVASARLSGAQPSSAGGIAPNSPNDHQFSSDLSLLVALIQEVSVNEGCPVATASHFPAMSPTLTGAPQGVPVSTTQHPYSYGVQPHGGSSPRPRQGYTVPPAHRQGVASRTSPSNAKLSSLCLCSACTGQSHGAQHLVGSNHNFNNGRSTIDTEISDSLDRISYANQHTGPTGPHGYLNGGSHGVAHGIPTTGLPESYEYSRPPNPSHGLPPAGVAAYAPLPMDRHSSHHSRHGGSPSTAPSTHLLQGSGPSAVSRRMQPSVNTDQAIRSSSNHIAGQIILQHPRAVKPTAVRTTSKGRSTRRVPRSKAGKNVTPSNHSAFSECSGGETRSYQSTNTATLTATMLDGRRADGAQASVSTVVTVGSAAAIVMTATTTMNNTTAATS